VEIGKHVEIKDQGKTPRTAGRRFWGAEEEMDDGVQRFNWHKNGAGQIANVLDAALIQAGCG
jgi:hypothetical protein